jgi:hypothetical protein
MLFGINLKNVDGEVIIDSELKNLHYVTRIDAPTSTTQATGLFGGRRVHTYRVDNCSATPVPFLHYVEGTECAVISVQNVNATTWDVLVLTNSGDPVMYVFAYATSVIATDLSGLLVYNNDGTKSFDSRSRPLAVTGAAYVTPPLNPRTTFSPSGLNPKYCGSNGSSAHSSQYTPDTKNTYSIAIPTKPMFFYFSVAQTERQAQFYASEQECDTFSVYDECVALGRKYEWWSTYWAFYRATISYSRANAELNCQWTMADFDCFWEERQDNQSFGFNTGGSSGAGGAFPLTNQTINTDLQIVLISDANRYD